MAEPTADDPKAPREPKWFRIAVAVMIGVLVAMTYAVSLRRGHWPLSHPWAGIALALFAGLQFVPLRPSWARIALGIGALAAAALWTIQITR